MSEIKVKVGKELLGESLFIEEWTVGDLYGKLMEMQDKDAASEKPMIASMQKFYLKIYGWYNPELVKDHSRCTYCPDNPSYRRYQDYNHLLNDKEQVLVLVSNYNDFREYDVYCSYYSDKRTNTKEVKKNGCMTVVELCGTKKTFLDKIKERLLSKELCM